MTNEDEMKVWMDLCDKHARLLIDEEDYEDASRLDGPDDMDWPCLVEDCRELATVRGLVRVELAPKKKEASA